MLFAQDSIRFFLMTPNHFIHSSQNALVIHLDRVQIEDIVESKLDHYLKFYPLQAQTNVLKRFYEPIEQALIEFGLENLKGNQLKTAKALGINRNTLKKKIKAYNLNIEQLLMQKSQHKGPKSGIFLSSARSMDLLSACQAQLSEENAHQILKDKALKRISQSVKAKIIQKVLEFCKGNQVRAAEALGINRNTLKKKIKLKAKAS